MTKSYEIIILGSGLSGSLLATILAKNNVRVCMIDNDAHPRFAIGESTVAETTTNLKIMSKLYDIPEIENLSNFFQLRDSVGSSHGIKKGFSFAYHYENQPHRSEQCMQTPTLTPPLGPDAHLFRQDTDQYMLSVAISYGADVFQNTKVKDIDMLQDGVTITTDKGIFQGEFIVDASGARSPIVKKMGIRDEVSSLQNHSRGYFTHMVGVDQWENISPPEKHGLPYCMDQTTLHHIFNGGWMWVIPFNNHAQSTNKLCSVGVVLDSRKWPKTDLSPEEEFETLLNHYPDIKKQFESAKPARKWISSGHLQFSSKKHFVDRYFALPATATFVDPLFSSGLVLTTYTINFLAGTLIESLKSGELDADKLKVLEKQLINKTQCYDTLVTTAYKAFGNFELWNAWYRVWEIGTFYNTLGSVRCIMKYLQTKDTSFLEQRFKPPYSQFLAMGIDGYKELFDNTCAIVNEVDNGNINNKQGVDNIYAELEKFDAMPSFMNRRDPKNRALGKFTLGPLTKLLLWAKLYGPETSKSYYDFRFTTFTRLIFSSSISYIAKHIAVPIQFFRSMLFSRNEKIKTKNTMKPTPSTLRSLVVPTFTSAALANESMAEEMNEKKPLEKQKS